MLLNSNSFSVKHWTCQTTIEKTTSVTGKSVPCRACMELLLVSWSTLPKPCPGVGFCSTEVLWVYLGVEAGMLLSPPYLIVLSFLKYTLCWLRNSHILWCVTVYFAFLSVYLALLFLPLHWTLSVQVPLLLLPWNNWIVGSRKHSAQLHDIIFLQNISLSSQLSGN